LKELDKCVTLKGGARLRKGYRSQKVIEFKIGEFRLWVLSDGLFRLDGGAMFGVVPRILWEKNNPPDKLNRITMGLNPLLAECGDELVLIDTGIGDKYDDGFGEMFSVEQRPKLVESLADAGFSPEDVTIVINTHLHFDHVGGNTIGDENGRPVPTFPSASYVVQEGEWKDAMNPNERSYRSYLKENYLPLETAGLLRLVNGEVELTNGVRVVPTPGHTSFHQSVLISCGGESVFYPGDLIPTSSHVPYPYIMGYDLFPLKTLEQKKEILPRAFREEWLIVFEHDPVIRLGKLEEKGKGFRAVQHAPNR
jgi:glyoxylase-like metal-dependent hydrolase (beta-lactamase superfamily II)